MRPKRGPARIDRIDAVDGIMRQRHEQKDDKRKGDAQAQQPLEKKCPRSLALETWPNEQAGEQKHEGHQKDVLCRAEQVEADPARLIDDRYGKPVIGRRIEWRRRAWLRGEISQYRVETDHQ